MAADPPDPNTGYNRELTENTSGPVFTWWRRGVVTPDSRRLFRWFDIAAIALFRETEIIIPFFAANPEG